MDDDEMMSKSPSTSFPRPPWSFALILFGACCCRGSEVLIRVPPRAFILARVWLILVIEEPPHMMQDRWIQYKYHE